MDESNDVEILEIDDPDVVIDLYERNRLQDILRDDYNRLKMLTEQRNPQLVKGLKNL